MQHVINACLSAGRALDEHIAAFYVCELLLCVERMHTAGLLHCDIKPDNVLLASSAAGVAYVFLWLFCRWLV